MIRRWEILETTEYSDWFVGLTERQQAAIRQRLLSLETHGPSLGRPTVDHVKGSRFNGMKELRVSSGGHLRILFIFDPRRRCVLLLGGDKSEASRWNAWYTDAISRAETLYERHLRGDGE